MSESTNDLSPELIKTRSAMLKLRDRLREVVLGRDEAIDRIVVAFFADGHVLLEDYPGSGKTTLAKALGQALNPQTLASETVGGAKDAAFSAFQRIQFTPDLLPSDITGTTVFEPANSTFRFRRGPVFTHVLLADEINRASPKVQSALLEAMAEKQVSEGESTHRLDELFFVIATQNPLDVAGTYPLPTPQLDRFLFQLRMKPIRRDAELQLLAEYPRDRLSLSSDTLVSRLDILNGRKHLRDQVFVHPKVREAMVDVAVSLRADPQSLQPLSTRALMLALPALQAHALLRGSDHVGASDFEEILPDIFSHRLAWATDDAAVRWISNHLAPRVDQLSTWTLSNAT